MEHQNEQMSAPSISGGGGTSDNTDYVLSPKERRRLALEEVFAT
jgi:hypothetical protein